MAPLHQEHQLTQQLPQLPTTLNSSNNSNRNYHNQQHNHHNQQHNQQENQQHDQNQQHNQNQPHNQHHNQHHNHYQDNTHPLQSTTQSTSNSQQQQNKQQQQQNKQQQQQNKPIEFPSYSSVLDIRMPNSERPSSFTHSRSARNLSHASESEVRRKTDSNHPFQKLHQQPTYLSDRQSIHSNRQLALDRHKKSARQATRSYQNHPLHLILCCHAKYPTSTRPSLSSPLTRKASYDDPESSSHPPDNPSGLHPSKKTLRLPLQTLVSAGLLIAIPSLFIYSTASDLIQHQRIVGIIILAIFSYVWLISLSSMIKTVTSDPGILPRGLDPNPEMQWKPAEEDGTRDERRNSSSLTVNPQGQLPEEKQAPGLEVGEWELLPRWIKVETFKSKPSHPRARLDSDKLDHSLGLNRDQRVGWVQSKWCTSCETYRPPRSSHCRICDCCIDGIDHHCSYLNNCIGSRNYRSFFVFLLTSSVDLMIMIACSIWKLFILQLPSSSSNNNNINNNSVLDSLQSHPIDIVIVSLSILIFIPIFALAGYHIFLTCNGLTTIEYIKAQTTKKVIKESAELVDEIYKDGGGTTGVEKKGFGCQILSKFGCGSSSGKSGDGDHNEARLSNVQSLGGHDHQRRSNNFVIGRLCRPDTEAFIDWNSLI